MLLDSQNLRNQLSGRDDAGSDFDNTELPAGLYDIAPIEKTYKCPSTSTIILLVLVADISKPPPAQLVFFVS